VDLRDTLEVGGSFKCSTEKPSVMEVVQCNAAVAFEAEVDLFVRQSDPVHAFALHPHMLTKLKYCAIIGAAGLEKFKLNEYSVEPR
jgi:hypothetical protein